MLLGSNLQVNTVVHLSTNTENFSKANDSIAFKLASKFFKHKNQRKRLETHGFMRICKTLSFFKFFDTKDENTKVSESLELNYNKILSFLIQNSLFDFIESKGRWIVKQTF